MKINIDRNVVEITPEAPQETEALNVLWRIIIDCYGNNKKLVPIGQFVPGIDKLARFNIEGVAGGVTTYSKDEKAPEDDTYYCRICNKYIKVDAGEPVPQCCGCNMEVID